MKRTLYIALLLLIPLTTMGQSSIKYRQATLDTLRLKNLTVLPDSILGYGTLAAKDDSLWFVDQNENQYNLLKYLDYGDSLWWLRDTVYIYVDSLNYLRDTLYLYSDSINYIRDTLYLFGDSLGYLRDTVYLYADSLNGIRDTLYRYADSIGFVRDTMYLYVDSINLLQDTALVHDTRIRNLEGKTRAQDIWQKDSDSTTSSKYPVNLSSLRLPPDSRVIVGNLPNISAPYNDTLSVGYILSGEYVFRLFGISDGSGGLKKYGIKVLGLIEADSTNIGYIWADSINTGKYLLNGVDINKTGTLDSIAYRNRDNDFLKNQTIQGRLYATDIHASDSVTAHMVVVQDTVVTAQLKIPTGASNGYVWKSDANGLGSWQQITNAYKGTWNANTNTPTLADGVGTAGDFYLVSVGDTIDLGSGNVIFLTGGTAIYNGAAWEAVNPSQAVTTVNSLIGDVQLELIAVGDSILTLTGGADSIDLNPPRYFQKELTADAENNIPVGFPIGSKTKVFYNGTLIEQTRWTGSGTSTITLSLDTRKYDTVTITN